MLPLVVFVVGSFGIIFVSWKYWQGFRSHGLFRFFAFESILALVALNLMQWFLDPFSIPQVVSWLLLLSSLVMAVHGFYLLRVVGRPQGPLENTTRLVQRGVYRYIRHPLYSSLLFLGWGAFFKGPSILTVSLAVVASASLLATAKVEEGENQRRFGKEYADYMRKTKMFIPFLI